MSSTTSWVVITCVAACFGAMVPCAAATDTEREALIDQLRSRLAELEAEIERRASSPEAQLQDRRAEALRRLLDDLTAASDAQAAALDAPWWRFDNGQPPPDPAAAGFDFGLRVRVQLNPVQFDLFDFLPKRRRMSLNEQSFIPLRIDAGWRVPAIDDLYWNDGRWYPIGPLILPEDRGEREPQSNSFESPRVYSTG